MSINNQKDLSFGLANHAFQELGEHVIAESFPKNHKRKMPFVSNRRDHVATESLPRSWDDRSFTLKAVGPASSMIGPQSHLVTPINLGFFALRLSTYPWILMRKPVLYFFSVLLKGPTYRFLRGKTPLGQVAAHGPDRKLNSELFGNQLSYGFASPQVKRQLQLVRQAVLNSFTDLFCLPWLQRPAWDDLVVWLQVPPHPSFDAMRSTCQQHDV